MAPGAIALTSRDRDILISLIGQFLPRTPVWAFGSRVTGTFHPWSDLDLVVFTGAEQRPQVSLLKEALDESNLPFRVDLLEWDGLPETFKENIKAAYVILQGDE
ncbi:nucleotidyltransferase family protein [Treponema primitia]|uniref:nucleotidyltransferase family protein n=1 Tax=Treponema primitia TaxID=88058 RepID=UPI0002554D20|nr:nucleotidyltransferase domain-containing protein [Treponema primitia]